MYIVTNRLFSNCILAASLILVSAFISPSFAETCEATTDRHAYKIRGRTDDGKLNDFIKPEIYGSHNFAQELPNGWVFRLGAAKYGWAIYLFSNDGSAPGVDMSEINPPYGGVPNSREIYGWHFRNQANTGPNEGDVNAPQHLRRFLFSRSLIGTGGFKSSTDPGAPRYAEPDPNDGRGWLNVFDYGLSDLEADKKARMTYLKFDACLTWPKTEDEKQIEADNANPTFMDEDIEAFGSCRLDLATYELNAAIVPRKLGGDIDGDDAIDEIAQIQRKSDGRRGLVLCRAGTWAHLIGMKNNSAGAPDLDFMPNMETWRLVSKDHGNFGYENEPDWPQADGDILVMERIEKEMVLIYWQGGALKSQQVYHFVEP